MNISKIITFWEFRGRLFEAIGRRGAPMGRPVGYGRLDAALWARSTQGDKKRRSPAFNHFALGCQRRVALPTQTKDVSRIDTN